MVGKLVILVNPHANNDPEVILSQRNVKADGATKIRWKKNPDWVSANPDLDFDFLGFVPIKKYDEDYDNPFKKIKINKNRIKCQFVGGQIGPEYKYTLAIEFKDQALNSDIENPPGPSDGRAVIRN